MVISVVGKRILKSGMLNRKIDRKGGILDMKFGQKNGNTVLDFIQKGGRLRVNISNL